MKSYKYTINNLDCANCAKEIEKMLNKDYNLKDVKINFSKELITFKSTLDDPLDYVNKKIIKVEDDVIVSENKIFTNKNKDLVILIIGICLFLLSLVIHSEFISKILLIVTYILLLYKVFIKSIKGILHGIMNENLLIFISCIGAYFVDKKVEGLMVIILYTFGKILEEKALSKSRKSISNLMDIRVDSANLKIDNTIKKIELDNIKIGDILVVRKGEKIPVDGEVIKGISSLDVKSLTGEVKPLDIQRGSLVTSGAINLSDVIEVKALKEYQDSNVSKILNLIENCNDKKAKKETKVNFLAKIYTPIVILLAILVAVLLPLFSHISYKMSIYRALTFLVISCPCAIVISVPLSYFSGIGAASHEGILVKGSDVLDLIRRINVLVFDKTGTITTGKFKLNSIKSLDPDYSKEEIFKYIYAGEKMSIHPLAQAITSYKTMNSLQIKNFKEFTGRGVTYTYKNHKYKIGSSKFVKFQEEHDGINIYLSIDDKVVGYIILTDEIKSSMKENISLLKKKKLDIYMFSGDNKQEVFRVAKSVGINNIKFNMLPQDKYSQIKLLQKNNHIVSFVGDGINDALVLGVSDVGIAMGLSGSNAAIEASDVVMMNDDISKISVAIEISNFTNKIINENLVFAICVKLLILLLSIGGISTMYQAVFADVGVTILSIFNTLRILKK